MQRVVCFGELLARLAAPDGEALLQTPRLNVTFAGAEANVAVNLARLGRPAAFVSVLPENRLGDAALEELRRHGVDVAGVRRGPGRMGLFFLTPGAVLRPSEVLYDRAGSAIAIAEPELIDWREALAGAGWLHVSGVTPALGPQAAEAAVRAVEAAVAHGVRVAFDGNFRAKLWALWDGDPAAILGRMLACASVAFVDDRDIARALGRSFEQVDAAERRRAAALAAFDAYPRLQAIAHTVRKQEEGVGEQTLSAVVHTREGEHRAAARRLTNVVDRIGGGDAFAAGVLHVLADGGAPGEAAEFGLALSALKHGVRGDFAWASEADVRALMAEGLVDVRR